MKRVKIRSHDVERRRAKARTLDHTGVEMGDHKCLSVKTRYVLSVLVPVITKIMNLSLSSGNFPMVFKHSLVTPLLKGANLDKENPSSYHPI